MRNADCTADYVKKQKFVLSHTPTIVPPLHLPTPQYTTVLKTHSYQAMDPPMYITLFIISCLSFSGCTT